MQEQTTVNAYADDLMVLRAHARRQGKSLSAVLCEAVAREADPIRAEMPKPRFGYGRSGGGSIAELLDLHPDEPYEAHPFRS